MVYRETPLYKSIEAYDKATGHRFFLYAHSILLLLLYEGFLWAAYNPHVLAYNGSDLWFKVSRFLPGGTLLVSSVIIVIWGRKVWIDWFGIKTKADREKDRAAKKKNNKFLPKPKPPYRPNWHYFGFQALEGFVYSAFIQMLLPPIVYALFWVFTDNIDVPSPMDANDSLHAYHTNFVQNMALAFGAGFYEELIFRGYLFAGLIWLSAKLSGRVEFLKKIKTQTVTIDVVKFSLPKFNPKDQGFLLAITIGTVFYALSHYVYPFGDLWSWYSFVYRFFFGLIMYYIFVNRRFAVAAWTHVCYDLWYFILN